LPGLDRELFLASHEAGLRRSSRTPPERDEDDAVEACGRRQFGMRPGEGEGVAPSDLSDQLFFISPIRLDAAAWLQRRPGIKLQSAAEIIRDMLMRQRTA
jgi:hypothetical protein